ncbi:Uncharacterised protein [Actinomyces bovis]|uniref:DUF4235 domain-containing protein n=1 Tax=Actinomyces bovis TaxID=1658 RepID=A0ABY1VQU7_9ACTO|nr:DUF4235 domain-containing protein [Actinomyces bovis]SPT55053.1 Uncharacterised protein [Actinomyces bovis]VEG56220.1 Uncharacterised protein [Actinomyces israelii]
MAKKTKHNDLVWKATAAISTVVAGLVADKVVAAGWRAFTGRPAPKEQEQLLDYKLLEVVTFAVLSGAALTLTRELSLRQVAKWYGGKDLNPLNGQRTPAPESLTA